MIEEKRKPEEREYNDLPPLPPLPEYMQEIQGIDSSKQQPSETITSLNTSSDTENDTINKSITKSKRRTLAQLRNLIIESLRKYPKTTHSVGKDCSMRYETAYHNLRVLEYMKIVEIAYEEKQKWTAKNGRIINRHIRYWKLIENE